MSVEARMDAHIQVCKWCEADILYAAGANGVRLRLDADPAKALSKGNLAVTKRGSELAASLVTAGQAAGMLAAGQVLYTDHALTCPKAAEWHTAKTHGKSVRNYSRRR